MALQSRREFLEQSLFAATAAALAASPRTQVQAEDQGSKSPNEKLRVACVGVRGRGGSHLSAFSGRNDTEVTVVCDVDENVGGPIAQKMSDKSGKPVSFVQDIRKVVEDPNVDIVTVATPNHWHSLASIWAVQGGKDVYVEKPVSHNVSEGRRMVQASEKYGKIIQTGTQCRSMKGTIEAIEFVKSGGIGEVKLARGLCYKSRGSIGPKGNYEVPSSVDYNIWLGPAPEKPLTRKNLHYDWHWQWDYGNGDLGNQGIHQMDISRWGLGVTGLGDAVVSYGGRVGYVDAGETANSQICIHHFGDKQLVFEVRGLKTGSLRGANVGVIFYGSDGYVVLNNYTGGAAFDNDRNMIKKFDGGGDHFANFMTAVRSRKREDLAADILEGHYSSALCHLGNISYRLGSEISLKDAEEALAGDEERESTFDRFKEYLNGNGVNLEETPMYMGPLLKVNSEQETFEGDHADAANPMLTREYRKPFVVPSESEL